MIETREKERERGTVTPSRSCAARPRCRASRWWNPLRSPQPTPSLPPSKPPELRPFDNSPEARHRSSSSAVRYGTLFTTIIFFIFSIFSIQPISQAAGIDPSSRLTAKPIRCRSVFTLHRCITRSADFQIRFPIFPPSLTSDASFLLQVEAARQLQAGLQRHRQLLPNHG
ncbi:hypothetical protein PIB30_091045 [Stylosanthes scabra]|uniref:Uncharacterized protein n=1 Tax=Stylosanthes scabra TaxID=79078 RepID=A0ABU6QUX3_9FABA|nr:hypothetical protein [Stylosanthes scabra]